MKLEVKCFSVPKIGNPVSENDDRYMVVQNQENEFKCAVSDGATARSWSGKFADELAKSYCQTDWTTSEQILQAADGAGTLWTQYAKENIDPEAFWADHVLQEGAAAAIVGLTLKVANSGGIWSACAVGDSCLFQLGANDANVLVPKMQANSFSSNPKLFTSIQEENNSLTDSIERNEGVFKSGDTFVLASDAISCFILKSMEQGKFELVKKLLAVESNEQFASIVQELSELDGADGSGAILKNDDQTLVNVHVVELGVSAAETAKPFNSKTTEVESIKELKPELKLNQKVRKEFAKLAPLFIFVAIVCFVFGAICGALLTVTILPPPLPKNSPFIPKKQDAPSKKSDESSSDHNLKKKLKNRTKFKSSTEQMQDGQ
jgi:hypothetical protein